VLTPTGTPGSGSGLSFTLPVEAKATRANFSGVALKTGGTHPLFDAVTTASNVSTVTLSVLNTASTYGSLTALAYNVPASWSVDDSIGFVVVYEGV
jgi:hypothetical protein